MCTVRVPVSIRLSNGVLKIMQLSMLAPPPPPPVGDWWGIDNGKCLITYIVSLDADECVGAVESDSAVGERISQILSVCAVRELGQEICTV